MALHFYDRRDQSKTQQAIDYIKQCLEQISREENILLESASGITNKVMKIENCNRMGGIYSSISSYNNSNSYSKLGADALCEKAKKHADELYQQSKDIHEKNLPAIENNKKLAEAITNLMSRIGIPETYTTWEYKTSRSRTKTEIKHTAGWYNDLTRCVKKDDGWSSVEVLYKRQLENIENYRATARKEELKKQQEQEQKIKNEQKQKELAALTVKYGIDYTSSWDDVVETLLEKDKYLALAWALEQQRNNWSDGFDVSYDGIQAFGGKIASELDGKIYDSLLEISESVEDGREYRDCEYNYSVLYGMVEDGNLLKDFEIAKQYIDLY